MKYLKIALLLIVISFTSCKSSQSLLTEQWQGKVKTELIQKKGAPDWTDDDGQGGKILVYSKRITKQKDVSGNASGVWRDQLFTRKEMYFVNSEGKIYNILVQDEPL
ncbi:hypothetical protein [Aureivirga marina]|uniref:hypothetical protein n=1 Tax=Aureivirga marina TaxID=1182451 RepID=UPI0018C97CDF|nr:hypothetical protein [Aureivirga marina]